MTSKEKISEILDWVQSVSSIDWPFMCCLKQDLEHLATIAQIEGIKEAHEALKKDWNNT